MAKTYSERFILAAGSAGYKTYTVPAGKRAIVRNFLVYNSNSTAQSLWLYIASFSVYGITPGALQSAQLETRAVAYPGEKVEVWHNAAGMTSIVSGYLFDDTTPHAGLLPAGEGDSPTSGPLDDDRADPGGVGPARSLNRPGRRPVDQEAA